MQVELATCRIDEAAGQAGARAEERGYSICPVVIQNEIVLDLIGKRRFNRIGGTSYGFRADDCASQHPLEKAKQLLNEIDRGAVLVQMEDCWAPSSV